MEWILPSPKRDLNRKINHLLLLPTMRLLHPKSKLLRSLLLLLLLLQKKERPLHLVQPRGVDYYHRLSILNALTFISRVRIHSSSKSI